MSHGKIREDKNCLNCGHTVQEKFCPNCGQENTENRKPFHYLFTHFVEDFTHYDGQFWGTIKNLLFKPGALTETYVEGKRQRFVPPVKLYIFISFITFFLFAVFPPYTIDFGKSDSGKTAIEKSGLQKTIVDGIRIELDSLRSKKIATTEDSIQIKKLSTLIADSAKISELSTSLDLNKGLDDDFPYQGFTTRKSFDSAKAKTNSIYDFINIPVGHKIFELKEKGVKKGDIYKNLFETSVHNLPKALFIYLPIFAFFLWIFHNKKKWWYFEHGVFTLHYFSFLLIMVLAMIGVGKITLLTDVKFIKVIFFILLFAMFIYSVFYFFIAHRRVYKLSKLKSFIIGFVLLLVNYFAFLMLMIGLAIVSFLMIH